MPQWRVAMGLLAHWARERWGRRRALRLDSAALLGGIVSAAGDGARVAEVIAGKWAAAS